MTPNQIAVLMQGQQALNESQERIEQLVSELVGDVKVLRVEMVAVKDQTTKTNGRVTVLERSWEQAKGFAKAVTMLAGAAGVVAGLLIGAAGLFH